MININIESTTYQLLNNITKWKKYDEYDVEKHELVIEADLSLLTTKESLDITQKTNNSIILKFAVMKDFIGLSLDTNIYDLKQDTFETLMRNENFIFVDCSFKLHPPQIRKLIPVIMEHKIKVVPYIDGFYAKTDSLDINYDGVKISAGKI